MSNVHPLLPPDSLFAEVSGRPGDWWEPAGVGADAATALLSLASALRLPVDLLAALVIERELLLGDVGALTNRDRSVDVVLEQEASTVALAGPGHLYRAYVSMLRDGVRDFVPEREKTLARRDLVLPLRLHASIAGRELAAILDAESVSSAIAYERAAASVGMFVREWGLRTLLRAQL